jgi:hypothetical protein
VTSTSKGHVEAKLQDLNADDYVPVCQLHSS